ncbi:hypothetical protein ACS0TY_019392 [Phlomoides rotata]
MSENNEGDDIARKGNEWEVVALTESAYAAAPGSQQNIRDDSHISSIEDYNAETANAMFMSGHFGLSASLHENMPLEPEYKEKYHEKSHDHDAPQLTEEKSDTKHEENLHIEGLIANESLDDAVSPRSNVHKDIEEDKSSEQPNLPCELWWRKQAFSVYGHLKNANPYWSVVVAATVMGLVIIGHRWQQEKPQVFQLKSQLILDSEGFID